MIVQLDFAARLDEQVVEETLKSPVVEIEMPVSETLCLLERVNGFGTLLVPTGVPGKVLLAGVNVAGTIPVPESDTV